MIRLTLAKSPSSPKTKMRLNKFIAQATGLSRRTADRAISEGRVDIDHQPAALGDNVTATDTVRLDGRPITAATASLTIMLNKPPGYVCSRVGQGSRTIYDLLPPEYHSLKPVGRLDKASSGLLLMTNDGDLANYLTHPRYGKTKIYQASLNKPLAPEDKTKIEQGVRVDSYVSRLRLSAAGGHTWQITMQEGHNRQIRRTFAALGYTVTSLHRSRFGSYRLADLAPGQYQPIVA
jgi:23S rRNA pseudouridine2605 synthase